MRSLPAANSYQPLYCPHDRHTTMRAKKANEVVAQISRSWGGPTIRCRTKRSAVERSSRNSQLATCDGYRDCGAPHLDEWGLWSRFVSKSRLLRRDVRSSGHISAMWLPEGSLVRGWHGSTPDWRTDKVNWVRLKS